MIADPMDTVAELLDEGGPSRRTKMALEAIDAVKQDLEDEMIEAALNGGYTSYEDGKPFSEVREEALQEGRRQHEENLPTPLGVNYRRWSKIVNQILPVLIARRGDFTFGDSNPWSPENQS